MGVAGASPARRLPTLIKDLCEAALREKNRGLVGGVYWCYRGPLLNKLFQKERTLRTSAD